MTKQTNKQTAHRLLSSILFFVFASAALAVPSTGSNNLQTTAGVTTQVVSGGLTITAPDRAVLSWTNFGSGTDAIAVGETLTYQLPNAKASVLNVVTGGANTQIDGYLESNGKVYILNPNGIIIGGGARINTAGLVLSTVDNAFAAQFKYMADGTIPSESGTRTASGNIAINSNALFITPNIVLAAKDINIGGALINGATTINADGTVAIGTGGATTVFSGDLAINNPTGNTTLGVPTAIVSGLGNITVVTSTGNIANQVGSRLTTKNLTVTSTMGNINLGADGALNTTATGQNVTVALDGATANPTFNGATTGTMTVTSPAAFTLGKVTGVSAGNFTFTSGGALTLTSGVHLDVSGATAFTGTTVTDSGNNIFVYGPTLFRATAGDVAITKAGHSFGPVSVSASGNATVYEAAALNLNVVNIGAKDLTLKTGEFFFQTPLTSSIIAGKLSLTAAGDVTFLNGNIAGGLTINAGSGNVDLSRLSLATNLNNITPTVTTTGTVTQPAQ